VQVDFHHDHRRVYNFVVFFEGDKSVMESVGKGVTMKHDQILERLLLKAKNHSNTLGFLVFGSLSSGTHNEKSDIDLIMILRDHEPSTGLENVVIDGIKVGKMYFTYEALAQNVNNVPYLMHIMGNAKLLFDREDSIKPLLEKINNYFAQNPKMAEEWNRYYRQFRAEKKAIRM